VAKANRLGDGPQNRDAEFNSRAPLQLSPWRNAYALVLETSAFGIERDGTAKWLAIRFEPGGLLRQWRSIRLPSSISLWRVGFSRHSDFDSHRPHQNFSSKFAVTNFVFSCILSSGLCYSNPRIVSRLQPPITWQVRMRTSWVQGNQREQTKVF
jgi:hypothetical protein